MLKLCIEDFKRNPNIIEMIKFQNKRKIYQHFSIKTQKLIVKIKIQKIVNLHFFNYLAFQEAVFLTILNLRSPGLC
jgi:hypothetical protein